MNPSKDWMILWDKSREKRKAFVDFNECYTSTELAGRALCVLDIGPCSVPTGRMLVRDPLCYLTEEDAEPYFEAAPTGEFPVELCVLKAQGEDCDRYAAARLCFTGEPAVRFEEALIGNENLKDFEEGEYFGFNVDAGLGCICDEQVRLAFCAFSDAWEQEHPNGNLYDDYFAALFKESYLTHPDCQRDGGDWINFQIPGTTYHLPFFQSGYGDGAYPVYWGYDAKGNICQLAVLFIDVTRTDDEDDEQEDD